MDKVQARFILGSFRPDGADAGDPEFAEALKLAMENRELGEWLAHERAFDAAFAQALGTLEMPETLREDIMGCLAAERGDFPQAEGARDAEWIGAMASIQPPPSLRDQVLAAMDRTAAGNEMPVPALGKISRFRRIGIPLAAAAGIALAFLITRPAKPVVVVQHRPVVPIETVQAGFMRTYESPGFHLEVKSENHQKLMAHLKEQGLPCPNFIPQGLLEIDGLGCRELKIEGKRGSLICFNFGADGLVHIVTFSRQDIAGDFPGLKHPEFSRHGEWATARFADAENVYLVLAKWEPDKFATLF